MSANIMPKKENFPSEDSKFEQATLERKDLIEEGSDVVIWYDNYEDGTLVFVTIGNTTMSIPEETFYRLTKAVQRATKELLGLE